MIADSGSLVSNFSLKCFLIFEQNCNELSQSSVERVQVLEFFVHLVSLCLHLGDLLLPWSYVLLKLLDFMIQHILKLLKLLRFFLEFINIAFVGVDSPVSLLNYASLLFYLSLKLAIRSIKALDFIHVLPLLLHI